MAKEPRDISRSWIVIIGLLIFLDTARQLRIRLTIPYNGGQTVSEETWLLPAGIP